MEIRKEVKRFSILFFMISAFTMHLLHAIIPHHHHETVEEHHHTGYDYHVHAHDHAKEPAAQQPDWLDELLSFVHYGTSDVPVRTENVQTGIVAKVIINITNEMPVSAGFPLIFQSTRQRIFSESQPKQFSILFKCRRGPPAVA